MSDTKSPAGEHGEERAQVTQRTIDARRELVYSAFRDPEQLARWWGPDGFTNSFREFDLRVGGYWRFTMHGPDGRDYLNESCFLEVVENERVVIEHFSGHHFILTITFSRIGDTTIVGWHQLFDTVEHYRQIADFVSQANEQNLDRLDAEVRRAKR
jgi:Activator of Hsp90 ATPase homolog 1-like protein